MSQGPSNHRHPGQNRLQCRIPAAVRDEPAYRRVVEDTHLVDPFLVKHAVLVRLDLVDEPWWHLALGGEHCTEDQDERLVGLDENVWSIRGQKGG